MHCLFVCFQTYNLLMKNVRSLCSSILRSRCRRRECGGGFRRCVGNIGVESSLLVLAFLFFVKGGDGGGGWRGGGGGVTRPAPCPSLAVTLSLRHHYKVDSQTVFKAEVGHCAPRPCNDSAGDSARPTAGLRPSVSMLGRQTTFTLIGQSRIVLFFSFVDERVDYQQHTIIYILYI